MIQQKKTIPIRGTLEIGTEYGPSGNTGQMEEYFASAQSKLGEAIQRKFGEVNSEKNKLTAEGLDLEGIYSPLQLVCWLDHSPSSIKSYLVGSYGELTRPDYIRGMVNMASGIDEILKPSNFKFSGKVVLGFKKTGLSPEYAQVPFETLKGLLKESGYEIVGILTNGGKNKYVGEVNYGFYGPRLNSQIFSKKALNKPYRELSFNFVRT